MSFLDTLLGGYKIIQINGTPFPARPVVNIVSGASATDNVAFTRTDVTITAGAVTFGGDVATATSATQTVVGIQGKPVVSTPPVDASFLVYNGASYVPTKLSGDATMSDTGQVTVAAGAKGITQLTGDVTAGPGSGSQATTVVSLTGASGTIVSQASNFALPSTTDTLFSYGGATRARIQATHGAVTAGGGGSDYLAIIGPLPTLETSFASLHLLANGVAPSSGNWAVAVDSASVYLSARGGSGDVKFYSAGSSQFGRFRGSDGALEISLVGVIQAATGLSTLTVGTNKTSAVLHLQSGAGLENLLLQNLGGGSLVQATTLGQRFAHQVNATTYTIDSSGAGDEQIWMTAAGTITLPNPAGAQGRVIEIIVGYDPAVGGGTIARHGSENINGAAANITLATGDKWSVLEVRTNGTDWVIKGGLSI